MCSQALRACVPAIEAIMADRRGVTALEYGLLAGLIAGGIVGGISAIGYNFGTLAWFASYLFG